MHACARNASVKTSTNTNTNPNPQQVAAAGSLAPCISASHACMHQQCPVSGQPVPWSSLEIALASAPASALGVSPGFSMSPPPAAARRRPPRPAHPRTYLCLSISRPPHGAQRACHLTKSRACPAACGLRPSAAQRGLGLGLVSGARPSWPGALPSPASSHSSHAAMYAAIARSRLRARCSSDPCMSAGLPVLSAGPRLRLRPRLWHPSIPMHALTRSLSAHPTERYFSLGRQDARARSALGSRPEPQPQPQPRSRTGSSTHGMTLSSIVHRPSYCLHVVYSRTCMIRTRTKCASVLAS